MRSFVLSIFAALTFAIFTHAAPMPAATGAPSAGAVVVRHDDHTTDDSLEVVLTTAIERISPITVDLGK